MAEEKGVVLKFVPSEIKSFDRSLHISKAKLVLTQDMRSIEKTSNLVHWYQLVHHSGCPIGWQVLLIKEITKVIGIVQLSLRSCWPEEGPSAHISRNSDLIDDLLQHLPFEGHDSKDGS